jgi:Ferric reductase like transmembrane component
MIIRTAEDIPPSEITPYGAYLNRRQLIGAGISLSFANLLAGTARADTLAAAKSPLSTDEKPTALQNVTSYNNYYEFGTSTYLVLDQGLDFDAIWADILKRLYITIGMACFVVLLPLAVTSNNLAIRRLGGKAWQRLHRLVYVAAILAVLRFLMSVKSWPIEPVTYAFIVAILLGYRLVRSLMRVQKQGRLSNLLIVP